MKLKIISDGTSAGTQIVNAETGEAVRGVAKVAWWVSAKDGLARASIEFMDITAEVFGDVADIMKDAPPNVRATLELLPQSPQQPPTPGQSGGGE